MAKQSSTLSNSTLADKLVERIHELGPITFRQWMQSALYDPSEGYYCNSNRERWGKQGDYRTSPQRSELFAATFARYFSKLHGDLGQPQIWTIVEAGAGDGVFAEGLLTTLRDEYPSVFEATSYVIDELGSGSRSLIEERLGNLGEKVAFRALSEIAAATGEIIFSNELFDAFPVHLVTSVDGVLREIYVDVDSAGNFQFVPGAISAEGLARFCEDSAILPLEDQVIEVNLEVDRWLGEAARVLNRGYIITVDYGAEAEELHARSKGTLRGYTRHQFVEELLYKPGEFDLTTTINWTQVRETCSRLGLEIADFQAQDQFLLREGALVELQTRLDRTESDAAKLCLTTAARDLILPGGMSSSFQVLVLKR